MPWFVYVWFAVIGLGVIASIALIGRPKAEPNYTPTGAIVTIAVGVLQVWAILYLVDH